MAIYARSTSCDLRYPYGARGDFNSYDSQLNGISDTPPSDCTLPFGTRWEYRQPLARSIISWHVVPLDPSEMPPITADMVPPALLDQVLHGLSEAKSRGLVSPDIEVKFYPELFTWQSSTALNGAINWVVTCSELGCSLTNLVVSFSTGFAKLSTGLAVLFSSIAFGGASSALAASEGAAAVGGTAAAGAETGVAVAEGFEGLSVIESAATLAPGAVEVGGELVIPAVEATTTEAATGIGATLESVAQKLVLPVLGRVLNPPRPAPVPVGQRPAAPLPESNNTPTPPINPWLVAAGLGLLALKLF